MRPGSERPDSTGGGRRHHPAGTIDSRCRVLHAPCFTIIQYRPGSTHQRLHAGRLPLAVHYLGRAASTLCPAADAHDNASPDVADQHRSVTHHGPLTEAGRHDDTDVDAAWVRDLDVAAV